MKSLFLFVVLCSFSRCNAQTITDVARSSQLIWYGIDFSNAKFSGFDESEFENKIPYFIKNASFAPLSSGRTKWLEKRFAKDDIIDSTDVTQNRNRKATPAQNQTEGVYYLELENVKKIVEDYHIHGKGYGLLLIAEFFDRKREFVQLWAAFIDNETGKVVSARRCSAKISIQLHDFYNKWEDGIETAIANVSKDLKANK
ncbi:MAG: hypothetical protein ABI402_17500 [Ferruginibacter sp.]